MICTFTKGSDKIRLKGLLIGLLGFLAGDAACVCMDLIWLFKPLREPLKLSIADFELRRPAASEKMMGVSMRFQRVVLSVAHNNTSHVDGQSHSSRN